jgi:hypothetical protein
MMVPATGYQPSGAPLPYPDDRTAPPNMGLSIVPQPMGTGILPQGFQQFVSIDFAAGGYPQSTAQTDTPPQNQKNTPLQPFTSVPNPPPGSLGIVQPQNFGNVVAISGVEPSPRESPKSRPKKGRAKANPEEGSPGAKGGRGQQSSQGMVVPIPNVSREVALKEQAMKRRRVDGEQAQDNADEQIIEDMLTRSTVNKGLATRKRKSEGKAPRREHHACDRCFRNKTKVSFFPKRLH